MRGKNLTSKDCRNLMVAIQADIDTERNPGSSGDFSNRCMQQVPL
jgi:hypothetical protein